MAQTKKVKKKKCRVSARRTRPPIGTLKKISGMERDVQVPRKSTKVKKKWMMSGTTTMMTTTTAAT
jgi:hypothetical protein